MAEQYSPTKYHQLCNLQRLVWLRVFLVVFILVKILTTGTTTTTDDNDDDDDGDDGLRRRHDGSLVWSRMRMSSSAVWVETNPRSTDAATPKQVKPPVVVSRLLYVGIVLGLLLLLLLLDR